MKSINFFVTEIVTDIVTKVKPFKDYQTAKEYYDYRLTQYKLIDIYISEVKESQENQAKHTYI